MGRLISILRNNPKKSPYLIKKSIERQHPHGKGKPSAHGPKSNIIPPMRQKNPHYRRLGLLQLVILLLKIYCIIHKQFLPSLS